MSSSRPFPASRVVNIAHRGGSGLYPENTLLAFTMAPYLGADMLEMDIQYTRDGALVIFHDQTVDRTTNGTGQVRNFRLAELKSLDAAYSFTLDGGKTYPYRSTGLKIPTLQEVLAIVPPHLPLILDLQQMKLSLMEKLLSILQDFHYQERVLVGSVYGKYLHNIRRLEPGIATGASLGEVIDYQVLYRFQGLDYWQFPFQVLMVPENRGPFPLVSKNWIKEAHRQRLEVYIWTINRIEDMKRLLRMGVDGIITDYPDRLAGLFGG